MQFFIRNPTLILLIFFPQILILNSLGFVDIVLVPNRGPFPAPNLFNSIGSNRTDETISILIIKYLDVPLSHKIFSGILKKHWIQPLGIWLIYSFLPIHKTRQME